MRKARGRFEEALDIILEAWKGEVFSYHGEYFQFENANVSPQPFTLPHPPLRVAATTEETFPRMGQRGLPIFVGLRGMDIPDLQINLKEYRRAWRQAGHPGDGDVSLRIPVYAGESETAAMDDPQESIRAYYNRMSSLYLESAGSAGTEATELRQGRGERLTELTFEEMLATKVAFGSAEGLIERITQLQEELGLKNVIAELNPGGLIPQEKVMRSMEILAKDVAPGLQVITDLQELYPMKIAVLDDYQDVARQMADWSALPQGAEIEVFHDHLSDEDQLVERLQDFQAVIGMRERTAFPRSVLSRLPELRLLITTGGRNASYDIEAATELGIVACGTGGAGEGPTELTWGIIIGLLRKIPQEDRLTRAGHWQTSIGVGLKGKTLGLIGLGHIGGLMARWATPSI